MNAQKYPVCYWDGFHTVNGEWGLDSSGPTPLADFDRHRIAAWASLSVPADLHPGTVRVFVDPDMNIETVRTLLKKIVKDMTGSWVKVTQEFPDNAKRALTIRQGDDHKTYIIE
ncbi:MAG: hypothetical protein ACLQBA_26115 [Candidatus Binataceae bacterium]